MTERKIPIAEDLVLDFSGLFNSESPVEATGSPVEPRRERTQESTSGAEEPVKQPANRATDASTLQAPAPQRKPKAKPFMSMDGKTDYRAFYSDLYKFHSDYSPPTKEGDYWERAVADFVKLGERYSGNSNLSNVLAAIFLELEQEYKSMGIQE